MCKQTASQTPPSRRDRRRAPRASHNSGGRIRSVPRRVVGFELSLCFELAFWIQDLHLSTITCLLKKLTDPFPAGKWVAGRVSSFPSHAQRVCHPVDVIEPGSDQRDLQDGLVVKAGLAE